MELSKAERLTLIHQFRILEKLYPEHAERYAQDREIIAAGYTVQYDDVFGSVFEEMSDGECRYVFDVLDMYRILKRSYEELDDKQGLTEEDVKFKGFDLNNEGKRYAFAEHLQKQGRWEETLSGYLNSHSIMTVSLYPKMLENFEPIREKLMASQSGNWLLTAEQIREVIS